MGVDISKTPALGEEKIQDHEGVHSHQLPSYLDELMWGERYGATSEGVQYIFGLILTCDNLQ